MYLLLECIVCFNAQALEHLQNGKEILAVTVLKEALALLAVIARHEAVELAQPEVADTSEVFPSSLTLFSLPSIESYNQGQNAPCSAVFISHDGTFSQGHGRRGARRILTALTLYHAALAIHRGCSRVNGMDRRELTRARDLYQAFEMAFVKVPELKPVKHILDTSIGNLYAMFDCPAAA
jgi:hypothetical protein